MICKKCKIEKYDQFYPKNLVCKDCFKLRSKNWVLNNPEKRRLISSGHTRRNIPKLIKKQKEDRKTIYGKSINVFSGIKFRIKHDKNYKNVELKIKRINIYDLLINFSGLCPLCNEVTDRPSIDRINSDGHYELSNLRIICLYCNQQGARIGRNSITGRFISSK